MAYSKGDLVAAIAEGAGLTKKAATDALEATIGSITAELASGGSVTLTGFGTFKVADRAARTGVNPRTGEAIQIPARRVPVFKAGKGLRDAV
jgi:DNA-binding protein HU-beta